MEPPTQNNSHSIHCDSPFKTYTFEDNKFNDFDANFARVRNEKNGALDSVILRRINANEDYMFEIVIVAGYDTFTMTCRRFMTKKCYSMISVEKTKVDLCHVYDDNIGVPNEWPVNNMEFPDKRGITALKLLNHFAMLNMSVFDVAQILLPSNPIDFRVSSNWAPRNLTVTVDESMKNKNCVSLWLNNILPASGVESLTINSNHLVAISSGTSDIRNLENITNLTINAKATIDIEFVTEFPNMNIVYNDGERYSPILFSSFATYWNRLKNKDESFRRRIEFNCKHSLEQLESLKSKIEYDERVFENNEIHERENSDCTRTFRVTVDHLLIDVNTVERNNGQNPPN